MANIKYNDIFFSWELITASMHEDGVYLYGDATVSKPVPVGEWNHVTITQNKGHLTLKLNGITVNIREPKGLDIGAACGQLGINKNNNNL